MHKPVERNEVLDVLRGVSALLVVFGHARAYTIVSYSSMTDPSLAAKLFYFATSLGHQAVIVFFVLSGYLVGGTMLSQVQTKRWSWSHYLLRRLTRLWIVILPALVMTFAFDQIGMLYGDPDGYRGVYRDIFNSGPPADGGIDHSLTTLIGNILFLQTVSVPIFGSNTPMWSLTNEFWYYILGPLLATTALMRGGLANAIATGLLAGLLTWFLPWGLLEGGLLWLAGAATALASKNKLVAAISSSRLVQILALGTLLVLLVRTKVPSALAPEFTFGLGVALALPCLTSLPSLGTICSRCFYGLSEISYTLYLTHFPVITLITMIAFGSNRAEFDVQGIAIFSIYVFIAIIWAIIMWAFFERHTNSAYKYIMARPVLFGSSKKT